MQRYVAERYFTPNIDCAFLFPAAWRLFSSGGVPDMMFENFVTPGATLHLGPGIDGDNDIRPVTFKVSKNFRTQTTTKSEGPALITHK